MRGICQEAKNGRKVNEKERVEQDSRKFINHRPVGDQFQIQPFKGQGTSAAGFSSRKEVLVLLRSIELLMMEQPHKESNRLTASQHQRTFMVVLGSLIIF
jgi:hypothetical protein